ncbi:MULTISPECIES: GTP pyrophosphokinase family protein [unclassified Aeromicrobium]|uniref:GTP pyrophosphokinase n=1 Tax=unclassified Aeromicrobium TaxID=2633570 RepID=UPI00396B3941
MNLIDQYIRAYEREYDYWDALASRARVLIEEEVDGSGLRAIVTSRAKSVERLREKLEQRNHSRRYKSSKDIEKDIVDRAGVRIALYFPSQLDEVDRIIGTLFKDILPKDFPVKDQDRPGSPRFTGYRARHYRGSIQPQLLSDPRYIGAQVEIQVASVLMHAWSEVEHDLVYKPLEGSLSETEYALLDQLNGLVQSGEIALEELLRAGDARIAAAETPFRNHFDLAEYLRNQAQVKTINESGLGAIDVLFDFLRRKGKNRPKDIEPVLESIDEDFERRPLADQISDVLLAGDPEAYEAYRAAKTHARRLRHGGSTNDDYSKAGLVGAFITAWASFEAAGTQLLQKLPAGEGTPRYPITRRIAEAARAADFISEKEYERIRRLNRLRNDIVHGRMVRFPTDDALNEAIRDLDAITERISQVGA